MRNIMMGIVTDKYTFMTEKTGISLDNLYQKTEKVTEECILKNAFSVFFVQYADMRKNIAKTIFLY